MVNNKFTLVFNDLTIEQQNYLMGLSLQTDLPKEIMDALVYCKEQDIALKSLQSTHIKYAENVKMLEFIREIAKSPATMQFITKMQESEDKKQKIDFHQLAQKGDIEAFSNSSREQFNPESIEENKSSEQQEEIIEHEAKLSEEKKGADPSLENKNRDDEIIDTVSPMPSSVTNKNEKTLDEDDVSETKRDMSFETYEVPLSFAQMSKKQRLVKLVSLGVYRPKIYVKEYENGVQEIVEQQKAPKIKKLKKKQSAEDILDEI